MIEAEFVLGGLEAVFDCPTMTFDGGECLDTGVDWAPCVKDARSPSLILRRIRRPRVQTPYLTNVANDGYFIGPPFRRKTVVG